MWYNGYGWIRSRAFLRLGRGFYPGRVPGGEIRLQAVWWLGLDRQPYTAHAPATDMKGRIDGNALLFDRYVP